MSRALIGRVFHVGDVRVAYRVENLVADRILAGAVDIIDGYFVLPLANCFLNIECVFG